MAQFQVTLEFHFTRNFKAVPSFQTYTLLHHAQTVPLDVLSRTSLFDNFPEHNLSLAGALLVILKGSRIKTY
jgi:hypothetical protein